MNMQKNLLAALMILTANFAHAEAGAGVQPDYAAAPVDCANAPYVGVCDELDDTASAY